MATVVGAAAPVSLAVEALTTVTFERQAPGDDSSLVTFGLPLPAGLVGDPAALALQDEDGPLPVQARALSRWPDGSLRWVLIDTRLRFASGRRREVKVTRGSPSAAVDAPLSVERANEEVTVKNGAITFRVPLDRFAIAADVRAHGREIVRAISSDMIVADAVALARRPRSVQMLEEGPLRVRLQIEGDYGNGFDYVVRIDALAGQPYFRVLHTFIHRGERLTATLSRLAITFDLASAADDVEVDAGEGRSLRARARSTRFTQLDNQRYLFGDEIHKGRSSGRIVVSGEWGALAILPRWFWEEYPKGYDAKKERLEYLLWDGRGGDTKAGIGVAKTHEFLVFATGVSKRSDWPVPAAVQVILDPAWVVRTGAFPNALDRRPTTQRFVDRMIRATHAYRKRNAEERWDDRGTVRCLPDTPDRPRVGAFGMWNWGDWNFRGYHDDIKGCDAWGNLEYDTPQVLALLYAASGDAQAWELMSASARHFMDVDRIHHLPQNLSWVGMNHPKNPLHFSLEMGGVDLGHTWTEGLLSYYYLTGDERALLAARGIADYLVRRVQSGILRANARQWGWPQIALISVYEATGEKRYRGAALEYARGAMKDFAPTSVTQWKVGVLADALSYVHAHTGDEQIGRWLADYARTVVQAKPDDARFYPAVAYVAHLERKQEYHDLARSVAERLEIGIWGKPFTLGGRLGFRILALLEKDAPGSEKGRRMPSR